MRFVVAPDKFKGSLSALEAAEAVAVGLRRGCPAAEVVLLPVADGGEGTVDAAVAAGYQRREHTVLGPAGTPVRATLAVSGSQAVVEMAQASGLRHLHADALIPLDATTWGTGELIVAALDAGAERIVLGIGGSATTDGGAGMVQALGVRLLDAAGDDLALGGAALAGLDRVDATGLDTRLGDVEVVLAGDVDNPLVGPHGAASVYGPQKGADAQQVAALDAALERWAQVLLRDVGVEVADLPGAGAAGGTGAAAVAFLGAQARSGIALVLDVVGFEAAARGADWVVTGEGSLDAQSLAGKAPVGVAAAARALGVPVAALVGRNEVALEELRAVGIDRVDDLLSHAPDVATAQREAASLLADAAERLARDVGA